MAETPTETLAHAVTNVPQGLLDVGAVGLAIGAITLTVRWGWRNLHKFVR